MTAAGIAALNMRHLLSYKMSKPNGISSFLVLNPKTNALFSIEDKQIKRKPNSVIITPPNTPYFYENPEGHYIDDWLRFETSNPGYFQELGLPFNCFIFPEDPNHINIMFQEIVLEFNYNIKAI